MPETKQPRKRRFPILISPLWRVLLLPFGATEQTSFAEIVDGTLHVRFGRLFDHKVPLAQVEGARAARWPVWAGIGPRTDFRGTVGLIGSFVNTVEVRLKRRQRVRMLLAVPCRRLVLSLEEPRDFVAAVGELPAPAKPRTRQARRRGRRPTARAA